MRTLNHYRVIFEFERGVFTEAVIHADSIDAVKRYYGDGYIMCMDTISEERAEELNRSGNLYEKTLPHIPNKYAIIRISEEANTRILKNDTFNLFENAALDDVVTEIFTDDIATALAVFERYNEPQARRAGGFNTVAVTGYALMEVDPLDGDIIDYIESTSNEELLDALEGGTYDGLEVLEVAIDDIVTARGGYRERAIWYGDRTLELIQWDECYHVIRVRSEECPRFFDVELVSGGITG